MKSANRPKWSCYPTTGFTLVELLVVIAIIGILVALLLPAIQAAREAARRSQCTNHLKQISFGALNHHDTHGFFPSGGWGVRWVGDADRGFGKRQPGGWVYSLLPFIEEEALHKLPSDGNPDVIMPAQRVGARNLISTPLTFMACPSRRQAIPRPASANIFNAVLPVPGVATFSDYCASAGSRVNSVGSSGPGQNHFPVPPSSIWWDPKARQMNGVIYQISEVKVKDVTDGTSKTYLVGEKYLNPDRYETADDPSDNESMFAGDDRDTLCNSTETQLPLQDTPGVGPRYSFGSAHPGAYNVAYCDGSVRTIAYDINELAHRYRGVRNDGEVIDTGAN